MLEIVLSQHFFRSHWQIHKLILSHRCSLFSPPVRFGRRFSFGCPWLPTVKTARNANHLFTIKFCTKVAYYGLFCFTHRPVMELIRTACTQRMPDASSITRRHYGKQCRYETATRAWACAWRKEKLSSTGSCMGICREESFHFLHGGVHGLTHAGLSAPPAFSKTKQLLWIRNGSAAPQPLFCVSLMAPAIVSIRFLEDYVRSNTGLGVKRSRWAVSKALR